MKIKTVKELRKYLEFLGCDDFELKITINERIPEDKLKNMSYPYPYNFIDAIMEIGDVGYSEKTVNIEVHKK
jgi:hypothetical protein